MKKVIAALTLLLMVFSVNAIAGEKEVLRAFETIKAAGPTAQPAKYNELRANVEVEINILKRDPGANPKFIDAATQCYGQYVLVAYHKLVQDTQSYKGKSSDEIEAMWKAGREIINKDFQQGAALLDELYKIAKP